jgi:hypothetical protein
VYSTSGSTKTAAYVVLANTADFSSSVNASDMVYLKSAANTMNEDGWQAEVVFLDGTGKTATITVDDTKDFSGWAAQLQTFYKFSVNDDDNIYTLTKS